MMDRIEPRGCNSRKDLIISDAILELFLSKFDESLLVNNAFLGP